MQSGIAISAIEQESIETVDADLTLHHRVLDQLIPWGTMDETITELDEFRGNYSDEGGDLIGQIEKLGLDGMDTYFGATEAIYEWFKVQQYYIIRFQCAVCSIISKILLRIFLQVRTSDSTA